ncbi:50S ribosomal protein L13 [bacterium]|uniref:Large ribosomal subunit protein uL13 n=2 Tax=Candidatus Nealsoniibacteriota TaxID=1817911 RepID=A0A2H9N323_9BACT|nr:50S ribosomal protein L13 [bacterium]PIW91572.1 MAG: 50S ribosomal protein L13 [Candidatus Nealsonbacteria bacterium CG_4_8_14_3_um_filter_37_36]PJA82722.1 MAG: 50S ribosomal protein L13 [Candidatus Nealsonbacteria bacterium CG_4_9_14_3_um_filter_37_29]
MQKLPRISNGVKRETHTIDATDKVLGRLAAQIAVLLRGKHRPNFVPYKDMGDFVIVENVNKLKFTGKKIEQKKYYRHSGYWGGLKEIPLKKLFAERPDEVLRKAVYRMLPKNKLRAKMIKRLKIK